MKNKFANYLLSAGLLGVVAFFSYAVLGHKLLLMIESSHEHELILIFFLIAVLFSLSFVVFYVSHLIKIPSFVIAIFFGLAAKPLLAPILANSVALGILVGLGATLILFSGGLETPFSNFKKLIWKIFSLSFVGLFITAFLFSLLVWQIGGVWAGSISMVTAVLLGAILASTDPAAIIPVLKRLRFKNQATKDIIVSESAVTDVVGTLLTVVFLAFVVSEQDFGSVSGWYQAIFNAESGIILLKQLFFGGLLGVMGYFLLEGLTKFKKNYEQEFEADSAFFLFVPIVIFTFALLLGGSGYLAAFVAGLIFHFSEHLHETERFFNNLVDGFLKPVIFILLGGLVDIGSLISYAPLGIAAALGFMFVIRPIAVFISMAPFHYFGKNKTSWRDIWFISFVRETGAIPAVLMVTVASLGLSDLEGLVEIGMWVILLTLIIEPLLTPWVAEYLQVGETIEDDSKIRLSEMPVVVLATRGLTFIERLPRVVDWAIKHKIGKITILLCLENKYTPDYEKEIKQFGEIKFKKINEDLSIKGEPMMSFEIISRKGFLQENINAICHDDNTVTAVFVGRKMLDYRLNEIKNLHAPLYFMD